MAIFASGAGSNAARIIDHFRGHPRIRVALIVSNKPEAGVLAIAERENIPILMIDKEQFFRGNGYVDELRDRQIDFIVLAGFLWKVPAALVQTYKGRIVNIHPALLPAYGGKGMYGMHVHKAVVEAREAQSGITIHFVDEMYDHGQVIFQASFDLAPGETPESLAQRIHLLEHQHFPRIIEQVMENLPNHR